MPLKLILQNTYGGREMEESTLTVTDDAEILAAAVRQGWKAEIQDPQKVRDLKLAQARLLELSANDPNSPERSQLATAVTTLKREVKILIPNPVDPVRYLIEQETGNIQALTIDGDKVAAAAETAGNAELARQREASAGFIVVEKPE